MRAFVEGESGVEIEAPVAEPPTAQEPRDRCAMRDTRPLRPAGCHARCQPEPVLTTASRTPSYPKAQFSETPTRQSAHENSHVPHSRRRTHHSWLEMLRPQHSLRNSDRARSDREFWAHGPFNP